MSQDYILHFQQEIPQIMIAQAESNGQIKIINIIKGEESLDIMRKLLRKEEL